LVWIKGIAILVLLACSLQNPVGANSESNLQSIYGSWDIVANGYHGTMTLDDSESTIQFEAGMEKLTDISLDGKNIKFYRNSNYGPEYSQLYTGEISGDVMTGTFTQQNLPSGLFQWRAERIGQQAQPQPPACDSLLLDLNEEQNHIVVANVVDACENNPLEGATLEIRVFHVYDAQTKNYINADYVDLPNKQTDENGEAFIRVGGNPGDMYRVDVYASKEGWDTHDRCIHVTI
jgi:hypothetical protein